MTYWTIIPEESKRNEKPSKVFKQLVKPGSETQRVQGYTWIHGFKNKKAAIEHLDAMGVPNSMRQKGFKSYDA